MATFDQFIASTEKQAARTIKAAQEPLLQPIDGPPLPPPQVYIPPTYDPAPTPTLPPSPVPPQPPITSTLPKAPTWAKPKPPRAAPDYIDVPAKPLPPSPTPVVPRAVVSTLPAKPKGAKMASLLSFSPLSRPSFNSPFTSGGFNPAGNLGGTIIGAVGGAACDRLPSALRAACRAAVGTFVPTTTAPTAAPTFTTPDCRPGTIKVGNQCVAIGDAFPGGDPFLTPAGGVARQGAFGIPALQPTVTQPTVLRCPPRMVLGADNLCYVKGTIPKQYRKHRPTPKPPMTNADVKALRRIGTLQRKAKNLAKTAGIKCVTSRRR